MTLQLNRIFTRSLLAALAGAVIAFIGLKAPDESGSES